MPQSPRDNWTSLVGHALALRTRRRVRLLSDTAHWTNNTAAIQRAQLRRILTRAQNTEFGRGHEFRKLAALNDRDILPAFRRAVPVADYSTYRPLINRMRDGGEPDILWPGLVMDYAQTSGTTAGDKFIPVSREMMRSNYRAALDIFANAQRFGASLPHICGGRVLFLGGSTTLSTNQHGIRTGDLSGLVTPLIKWPISEIYSPGKDIALMSHWPSKIEAMARASLDQDIRMINGMPSWALVLMDRVLELAREQKRIGAHDGIDKVWPNLTLFVHGGVKYSPFDSRIRQRWSGTSRGESSGGADALASEPPARDIPHRLELYPASEGFIAIQDTPHDPGLRLLTDIGVFYEFIPLDEIDDALAGEGGGATARGRGSAFAADEVQPGIRYVVTMTTCAGLYRYVIGDVVEFDTIPRPLKASVSGGTGLPTGRSAGYGPCRLRIVGRHRHFINAFGENLIVEHIENAVAAAAAKTGLTVGEFSAAPIYPSERRRAGLELVIETDHARALLIEPKLAHFADEFDAALKAQNVDYTTKRTDGLGMAPPTITPVPPGTFHRWMHSRGKLGGQHKCPRCANGREIVDSIKAYQSPGGNAGA